MAAAVRFKTVRLAIAAAVAASVVGGTAYFARTAPAEGATTTGTPETAVTTSSTATASSTEPTRRAQPTPTPAKRSRGS